ncbi:MAG: aspartate 1-decarboxylase [Campylobacterales bacterium]|nr:aspartate 1-decarboxylase [Campylobacterales bacterium]
MTIDMLQAKIHRARITGSNLDYIGSITIDPLLLEASGLLIGQKVEIVNINNGERFATYIIEGEKGSGDMCINGAAARKVQVNDLIIVIAYGSYNQEELKTYKPKVIMVDENNKITQVLEEI